MLRMKLCICYIAWILLPKLACTSNMYVLCIFWWKQLQNFISVLSVCGPCCVDIFTLTSVVCLSWCLTAKMTSSKQVQVGSSKKCVIYPFVLYDQFKTYQITNKSEMWSLAIYICALMGDIGMSILNGSIRTLAWQWCVSWKGTSELIA